MDALKLTLVSLEEGILSRTWIDKVIFILQQVSKARDRSRALLLHDFLCKGKVQNHTCIGDPLISMLVSVRSLKTAQHVFDGLENPTNHSIYCLVNAYVKCGRPQCALALYRNKRKYIIHQRDGQMDVENSWKEYGQDVEKYGENKSLIRPDPRTFMVLLKACGKLKDLAIGVELYAEAARMGWVKTDCFIGSSLIDMFAKCGEVVKAREVFDKLLIQDVVSWTTLIGGYVEHHYEREAFHCFEQMQLERVSPNAFTFVYCLKSCGNIRDVVNGYRVHAQIEMKGLLESDPFVGSSIIDMYAKFGSLSILKLIFKKLPFRDVVSWTALISGYVEHGYGEEALKCFDHMQAEGISPNVVTYTYSLKACGDLGATFKGREIHSELERRGLDNDIVIGSALVGMYTKCGQLVKAREIFDRFPIQNTIIWNALISGYVTQEHSDEALKCFEKMRAGGISPNASTFVYCLKAAACIEDTQKIQEIHADIERKGLLERDLVLGNTLIDVYAKCGLLEIAEIVFDELPEQDVCSWTSLIAGFVEFGYNEKALNWFDKMQLTGVRPNAFTYVFCLRACGTVRDEERIRGLHYEIQRRGFLNKDCVIGNTLVDLYAKCGLLLMAQDTFDNLHVRDTVAWTSLIAGYVERGMKDEALNCFEHMQLEGVPSSAISCISALKACGLAGALYKGREIHVQIERQGLLQSDIVVGNTLVNMYAKFGCLPEAQEVFNKLSQHNVASWTALMGAHHRHDNDKERLAFFEELRQKGVIPDTFLFVHSLKLCGNIGALSKGNEIYADIERRGLLERGIVGNAIVDMYAKAGLLINAAQVFGKLPSKDVVAWTALMAGYAQHGASDYVFAIFDKMTEDGVTPDEVTFSVVLHACQCSGQLKKGHTYFEIMSKEYGICPMHKHKASLVNIRGCLGQLHNTVEIAADAHLSSDIRVWHTLLDSCRHWGNLELGEAAFEHAVRLDQSDAVAYSLMSHMYATVQMVDGRMQ